MFSKILQTQLFIKTEKSLDEKVSRAINEDKLTFKTTQVTLLRHKISADGISPDPDLVQRILDIKMPTNSKRKMIHAFKVALATNPVIQPFDVAKETTLTTDASEQSIF